MPPSLTVNVIGLGYVGITTSLHLAGGGARVFGWDLSEQRGQDLANGRLPFDDAELVERYSALKFGENLRFVLESGNLPRADVWVVCVGTPMNAHTGALDTQAVQDALRLVLDRCLAQGDLNPVVVLRSTIPPLTYRNELRPILQEFAKNSASARFFYFPEFMREGSALSDCEDPPLLAIGCAMECESPTHGLDSLKQAFKLESREVQLIAIEVAEVLKVASNAFHALKVVFANEVSSLCDSIGVDGGEVMRVFVKDRKLNISPKYLQPGFAFGGPCLEKDLRSLSQISKSQGVDLPTLDSIHESNEAHLLRAAQLIDEKAGSGAIAFLGTGFKHGSADQRGSAVVKLIHELHRRKPSRAIHVWREPAHAHENPAPFAQFHDRLEPTFSDAGVVVLGPHPAFRQCLAALKEFRGLVIDLHFNPSSGTP